MTIYELKCLEFDHRIANRNIACNISAKVFNSKKLFIMWIVLVLQYFVYNFIL